MLSVTVPELVLNPNQSINQFDDNDNTSVNNKIAVEKLRKEKVGMKKFIPKF